MKRASTVAAVPLELVVGLRSAVARLTEHKTWVLLALGFAITLVVALVERHQGYVGAADRALSGAAFGVALPLLAYVSAEAIFGRRRLSDELAPVTRHGGSPTLAALGALGALSALLVTAGVALAVLTVLFARSPSDAAFVSDVAVSAWIGVLGGAAYAACFTAASSIGRRGGGRKWLLALDFVLGTSSTFLAVPWPRSHLRNLLGGPPPLGWSQAASAAALAAILVFTAIFALRRARA